MEANFEMGGNQISCPVGSVITSSPDRLAVLDNLFRQSINIVLFTTDDVSLFDGEQAPNMFPNPATHDSPLRSGYDRTVPTYPDEEFDHRRNQYGPLLTPPSFTVFEYINQFPDSFDDLRF